MKGIKLILLFTLLWSGIIMHPACSQEAFVNKTYLTHHFGDMTIAVGPGMLLNRPGGPHISGGINFQVFLFKYMSIESDLVIAKNYLHLGPGTLVLPIWMLLLQIPGMANMPFNLDGESFEFMLFMLIFTAISAEHLAFHIPLKNNTCLSPYLSLLRFRPPMNNTGMDDIKQHLGFATGMKLNKYFGRFILSPYLEYNIGYTDHISGINTGLYLGIYLPNKF